VVEDPQSIYRAVDDLAAHLRAAGLFKLADILHDRVHVAVWTTRLELLTELKRVLNNPETAAVPHDLHPELRDLIRRVDREIIAIS